MIKFQKFQGTGNDFIIFKDSDTGNINHCELAKNVCNRNLGIGADGMMLAGESSIADVKMSFYNADGSIATMCGNGIRCFAKFVYENKMVNSTEFEIETLAGIMKAEVKIKKSQVELVTVNLGKPLFFDNHIPKTSDNERYINKEIEVCKKKLKISSLVIGTIHTVVFVDNYNEIDLEKTAKCIENSELFPMKTNVNFCKILDRKNIEVLTWEKGVGMTLSCGTGAAASSVISSIVYGCDKKINVKLKGGELVIEDKEGEIFLTGTTKFICKGLYNMEERRS